MADTLSQDPEALKALLAQILAEQGGGSMSPLKNEAGGPPMGEPLPQMPPMPGRGPGSIENIRRAEDPMTPAHQMMLSGLMMMPGAGGPMKAGGMPPPWLVGGIAGAGLGAQGAKDAGYQGNLLYPALGGAILGAGTGQGGKMAYDKFRVPTAPPHSPGGPSFPGNPGAGPEITTTRPPLAERLRQGREAVPEPPPPNLTPEKTPTGVRYRGPGGRWYSDPNKKSSLVDALMNGMS